MDKSNLGPFASDDETPRSEPKSAWAKPHAEPLPDQSPAAVLSLRQAMRRARFDDAERNAVLSDLRAVRIWRLEILYDALGPLIAQIPDDVDIFDIGLMPGNNPRLFIDMIGFVEMGRDPRIYRFVQDSRNGRVELAQSEQVPVIVEAVTHYIARRLLERDKALAADLGPMPLSGRAAHVPLLTEPQPVVETKPVKAATPQAALDNKVVEPAAIAETAKPKADRITVLGIVGAIFSFIIHVLGSVAFFGLLAFAGWFAWTNFKH